MVKEQKTVPRQIDLKLFLAFLYQKKWSKSRLVKSQDFVASLTILVPVSRSHELASDFSRYLQNILELLGSFLS